VLACKHGWAHPAGCQKLKSLYLFGHSRIISTPSMDHVSALNFGLALYILAGQGHLPI
jgi:hypothetical protein